MSTETVVIAHEKAELEALAVRLLATKRGYGAELYDDGREDGRRLVLHEWNDDPRPLAKLDELRKFPCSHEGLYQFDEPDEQEELLRVIGRQREEVGSHDDQGAYLRGLADGMLEVWAEVQKIHPELS